MTDFLLRLARSMSRLADDSSGCGSRFHQLGTETERLSAELADLNIIPYARPRVGGLVEAGRIDAKMGLSGTMALRVVADQIGLPTVPICFDPLSLSVCAVAFGVFAPRSFGSSSW